MPCSKDSWDSPSQANTGYFCKDIGKLIFKGTHSTALCGCGTVSGPLETRLLADYKRKSHCWHFPNQPETWKCKQYQDLQRNQINEHVGRWCTCRNEFSCMQAKIWIQKELSPPQHIRNTRHCKRSVKEMSSKSYLPATYSRALCYWNLNKARCFPVPLTQKPMLWTLQLLWGNLHQGIGSRQLIYRNEAWLLWLKQCHRGWNIYLLIYLVSSFVGWCFIVPYDAAAFLPCSVHKYIDTRDKHEMDQRPPQTTAQLPISEPCVKGQSWDARVRMGKKRRDGLGHKIQFGCGKKWLAAYTSDCETLH